MEPTSPLLAFIALFIICLFTFFLTKRITISSEPGRYYTIDGLRGYLAFLVFVSHSCIWYFYLRSGKWEVPPSNLYTHFGQTSVVIFFMITGFLFFSKLLNARSKGIEWDKLFISRILRLVPLYLFAMLLLFTIVAIISNGVIKESFLSILSGMIRWLGFTILGSPDLNTVKGTSIILAGVTWSLPYEWFFYMLLPLFAVFLRVKVAKPYLIFSFISILGLLIWSPPIYYLLPFLGGIAAAFLVKIEEVRKIAVTRFSSFIIIILFFITVYYFNTAYHIVPLIFLSTAFILIAAGNDLFGLLKTTFSRTLGEMSYSIYLMHGFLLFITFNYIIGIDKAKNFSVVHHWGVIFILTPILLLLSYLSFTLIEKPGMQSVNKVTVWIRSNSLKIIKRRLVDTLE